MTTPPDKGRRPRHGLGAQASAPSIASTTDDLVTADGRVWTPREWQLYLDAWQSGYVCGESVGYDRGYAACDGEMATIQRKAARIVHAMANLPERDHADDQAAADRRAARWVQ